MMNNHKIIRLTELDKESLELARKILSADLSLHYTLPQLAAAAGINRHKLTYGFKQLFGNSIHQFIMKKRMESAKALLLETDKSVKEIALINGYHNQENFTHAFKKYYSCSPSSLRT